jgi:hypothetical protein
MEVERNERESERERARERERERESEREEERVSETQCTIMRKDVLAPQVQHRQRFAGHVMSFETDPHLIPGNKQISLSAKISKN